MGARQTRLGQVHGTCAASCPSRRWRFDPPAARSCHTRHSAQIERTGQTVVNFSPVNISSPDLGRFPLFEQAEPLAVTLEPGACAAWRAHVRGRVVTQLCLSVGAGDVLLLPAFWWHHIRSEGTGALPRTCKVPGSAAEAARDHIGASSACDTGDSDGAHRSSSATGSESVVDADINIAVNMWFHPYSGLAHRLMDVLMEQHLAPPPLLTLL